jgi:hypothetical protein
MARGTPGMNRQQTDCVCLSGSLSVVLLIRGVEKHARAIVPRVQKSGPSSLPSVELNLSWG